MRRGLALLVALVAPCTLATCKEPQSDHPYTPFGVVSVAEAPTPPPSATPNSSTFAVQKAVLAPLGAKQWALGGRNLIAPGTLTFEQALEADFDNDGTVEVVTWLTPDPAGPKPAGSAGKTPGELWLYDASSTPSKLFDAPGFLPVLGCKPQTDLSRTGPQTVTLQIAMRCEKPITGRMPTTAISVIAPRRDSPHVLTLRVASSSEKARQSTDDLAFEIATLDRDRDGRDDIELKGKLTGSNNPTPTDPVELSFVWLDRKAGLSRDTLFPSKNFKDIAALELLRSTGKNTSSKTPLRVDELRRLFGALCAEGHVPLVFDQDNNPLSCNPSLDTLGNLATAELRSFLTQKAWGNALTALLRSNWYVGPIPEKTSAALTLELEKAIPVRAARSLAVSNATASAASSIPRFSPLSFDGEGLLIAHSEGVTRLDLETFEESDVSEEIDPWPLTVISPHGERLVGVAYPCDFPTVTLLGSTDSGAAAPIATSLLSPRPGICGGASKGPPELPLRPVAWSKAGLRVFLGGAEIGPLSNEPLPRGSARSSNGEHAVIATELGLLLLHKSNAELWRADGLVSKRLQDCVIDDVAQHVACIDKGRARLLGLAPASAPPTPLPNPSTQPAQPAQPAPAPPPPPATQP